MYKYIRVCSGYLMQRIQCSFMAEDTGKKSSHLAHVINVLLSGNLQLHMLYFHQLIHTLVSVCICVYVLISFHSFRSWSGLLFTFSNVCVCECGEDATSRSSYIKCTPTFMWVKIRIHRLKSDSFPSLEKCSFNSALRLLHFAKFNHYLNRFVLHFIFGRYIFSQLLIIYKICRR